MVIERLSGSRNRKIGIDCTEQPFGDLHAKCIGAFVALLTFKGRQPALEPSQGLDGKLVWTQGSRQNAYLQEVQGWTTGRPI